MRLKILIEDIEYRDALIEALSTSEKNVYMELIDSISQESFGYGTILLTDFSEEKALKMLGENNADRIVILSKYSNSAVDEDHLEENKVKQLFKYQNSNSILSEIAELDSKLYGKIGSELISTRKYLVCGDSTESCSLFTGILSRQIRFRHGGTIMLLSLTYINSHPISEERSCCSFAQLMYMRSINRSINRDAYTYTDSYGITYLKLPIGVNPLAYMNLDALVSLCTYLCEGEIETLIIDIGAELSSRNQQLLDFVDDVLIVNHGSRSTEWNSFRKMQLKDIKEKTTAFSDVDIELNLDDFLREKYGVIIEDEKPENNSKTTRRRDRQARSRN